jgi:hypothetical protein
MDYLKRQLSRLREWRRPAALESSVLGKIPLELLVQIIEYLPAPSAAAFSISCMQIKRLIGDPYLRNLAGRPANTLAFLDILALDLPDQVVCSSCQKLHKMENAARYISMTRQGGPAPECLSDDQYAMVEGFISINFSSTVFRMAMKRYQQNPECSQLLKLLSYDTDTRLGSSYVKQSRADCRIIQGLMIHRVQNVFLSATSSTSPAFTTDPLFEICRHLDFRTDTHSVYVATTLFCNFLPRVTDYRKVWSTACNLTGLERHNTGSGLMRCHHCWTEFRIDFKQYPGHGMAMFFTRWKNLGAGPDDEDWKRNFRPWDRLPPTAVQFQAGALSSAFENGEEFKLDSLLSPENKTELFRAQNKWLSIHDEALVDR